MTRFPATLLLIAATLCIALPVSAATVTSVVDFESGYVEQQLVDLISVDGVDIAVSCGDNPGEHNCYTFAYGGTTTAYNKKDAVEAGYEDVVGAFGLTDEFDGPRTKYNYYFSFSEGITSFALDLLDYRGSKFIGESAILTLFAGTDFTTEVGQDVFSPTYVPPDGNVEHLAAVVVGGGEALSASLTFTRYSSGTGVDNLSFAREISSAPFSAFRVLVTPTGRSVRCAWLPIAGRRGAWT